jgi:hypothetical protein
VGQIAGKCRKAIFREQIRLAGFAIVAFGVMLTLASVFADQIALGMPGSGFGWKQITGTLTGLLICAAGGYILYRVPAEDDETEDGEQEDHSG